MNKQLDPKQDARISTLERYWWLSNYLMFWFAIELLLILAGVVNIVLNGLSNVHGLILLAIGACMALAHFLWVKKVRAFLDEKPNLPRKKANHLKVVK